MDSGLVTTLSGALAQSRRIEKLANNIANADTPAYKSQDLIFEEMLTEAGAEDTRGAMELEEEIDAIKVEGTGAANRPVLHGRDYTDLTPGALKQTGNPMDLAIEGNGFLEVASPQGVLLTRAGNLSLDDQGQLVNRDGFLILGAKKAQGPGAAPGAPVGPEARAIKITNGRIQFDRDGNVYQVGANGLRQNVGRLSLIQIDNPADMKPVGRTLWEAGPDAFPKEVKAPGRQPAAAAEPERPLPPELLSKTNPLGPTNRNPVIHQGMLEASNVNPVGQMTKLIEAHRLYDQNLKVMQNIGEMTGRLSEVGKF